MTTTVVDEGSWALDNSVVWAIDQNHVQLIAGNTKDEQADRGFCFIAIG
ncbi:hypothetical protein [Streptomyces sp. NBC_01669]|nr:hypothetical protein [Streptomyces sp. NBC_01669]MCX4538577.1 hypothetical protein [Streptomyces sp. NBC_01669]